MASRRNKNALARIGLRISDAEEIFLSLTSLADGGALVDSASDDDGRGEYFVTELVFRNELERLGGGFKNEKFPMLVGCVEVVAYQCGGRAEGAAEPAFPHRFTSGAVPAGGDAAVGHGRLRPVGRGHRSAGGRQGTRRRVT